MTNQLVKLRLCPLGAKWRNYWRQLCQGLGKGQCSESLLFNLLPPDFIDTRPAPATWLRQVQARLYWHIVTLIPLHFLELCLGRNFLADHKLLVHPFGC